MAWSKRYVALAILLAPHLAASCGGGDSGGTGGSGGGADGGQDGGNDAASCADDFTCTVDVATKDGCQHFIGPASGDTACPSGRYCTVEHGCVQAPACASDADCTKAWEGDACKANARCDDASSLCLFDALDKDGDGHPPQVCGGADCDDGDPDLNPDETEVCDGVDQNCDGIVDNGATCSNARESCQAGECKCRPENVCGDRCFDLQTDTENCGACGKLCALGESCVAGKCACPSGSCGASPCPDLCSYLLTLTCYGKTQAECLDDCEQTRSWYVGDCHAAFDGYKACQAADHAATCKSGPPFCSTPGCSVLVFEPTSGCNQVRDAFVACEPTCPADRDLCGGTCADYQTDSSNCGSCGNACDAGSTCAAGGCTCPKCNGSSTCTDVLTDDKNCGSCGNACSAGDEYCDGGICVPYTSCPSCDPTPDGYCDTTCCTTPPDPDCP